MLKYRKYFYILSGTLAMGSILAIAVFELNFGIDFLGGSLMEIRFSSTEESAKVPAHADVREALKDLGLDEIVVQNSGEVGILLRFKEVDEQTHQQIFEKLKKIGSFEGEELRFESIGPVIGQETREKAIWAMGLVLAMILVYVAWAFRRISFPLSSWKYGFIAIVALFHDILITIGIFAVLGHFLDIEVGVPFIAALLTILGYSVNDTIVVFDRIRENIVRHGSALDFGALIDKSVRETVVRSLNTSLTTLFALIALFLFGGSTITYFVLTLMIGVVVGTYSSICLASPLLFSWSLVKQKRR